MPRSKFEFDQANDSEFASQYELDGVKDNRRDPAQFVQNTMNNYDLWLLIAHGALAGNDCNVSMHNAKDRTDYFRCNETTYQVFATHIYRGTTVWIPNTVIAAVSGTSTNTSGQIRVWDLTHSSLVVEMDVWTGNTKQLISKSISAVNLPVGLSWLEFQIKQSVSEARVHAIGLYTA